MNKLGYNIRRLRNKLNLTQVELSELANVSSQVVSNWERGYTSISTADLTRLTEIFGVPADMILGTDSVLNNESPSVMETEDDLKRKRGMKILEKIEGKKLDHVLFSLEQAIKE